MHIEVLFAHDEQGRMTRINEPGGGPAPRFFLGRTAHGVEWRVRDDVVEPALLRDLELACESEPPFDNEDSAPESAPLYDGVLSRSAPIEKRWAGPAFCFPARLVPRPRTAMVTEANAEILRPHLDSWLPDVVPGHPMLVTVVEGRAAAVCASVRITAQAHEGGVETAPEFRGRGYAADAVSAWAEAVRELGAVPLYSTSWENISSRAVARKLELRRFGTDYHVT